MDSRKDMTKRLIADGFKALLLRYPFEKISIMMITNEAGIRRPSFYNHFQDKYDLLAWIVETDVVAPAGEPLRRGDGGGRRDGQRVLGTHPRAQQQAHIDPAARWGVKRASALPAPGGLRECEQHGALGGAGGGHAHQRGVGGLGALHHHGPQRRLEQRAQLGGGQHTPHPLKVMEM